MESLEQIVEKWRARDTEIDEFKERHWADLEKHPKELAEAEQKISYWNRRLLKGGIKTDSDYGLENALKVFHGQYPRMNVYIGIDPTIPDVLHLGHTVGLDKVRLFQELDSNTIIVIGDWTARIGDPSGSTDRPGITLKQARENAQSILANLFKILDKDKTTVRYNSEWHSDLGITKAELEEILMKINARDLLNLKRVTESKGRLSLLQFLYAAYQAIDAVILGANIQVGGEDQEINFQVGRALQRALGIYPQIGPQIGYMTPLLTGIDGELKMSKSVGNHIPLSLDPYNMFGKVMSIPDEILPEWYKLLTEEGWYEEFGEDPMGYKKNLAHMIVARYHGEELADWAQQEFERVFKMKKLPTVIPPYNLSDSEFYPMVKTAIRNNAIPIYEILYIIGMAPSKSQARRLIKQKGVRIGRQVNAHYDARKVVSIDETIPLSELNETIIKVGRRYGIIHFDYKPGAITMITDYMSRIPGIKRFS